MKTIGVIPARWGSVRFEGKSLALLKGKPLIQHVWERSKKSQSLRDVYIACDDARIFEVAERFGAKAVMTRTDHLSGTDRIAEAADCLGADYIVNIQGDEPFIHPGVIDDLVKTLADDPDAVMATAVKRIEDKSDLDNPNVVKVVMDQNQCALYFSRSAIPCDRDQIGLKDVCYYKHQGIYAYKKDFLFKIKDLPVSFLERAEKLEQLRVLEAGYKIKLIVTDKESIGIDTPEDLKKAEEQFEALMS